MARPATKQIFAERVSGQPGIAERLLDVAGSIPQPREGRSADAPARARTLARTAAAKAASAAGALALPPGPLGWLTIAPELYAVWKIQAQLVSDIAGAYGRRDLLTREQMLYCLFSHTAAGAFRQLVIRVGERYVVRRAPLSALYAIANKVAIRIAQRSAGRMVTRWIPALGALGVAGYVYIDTGRVADTAMDLFASEVKIEGELEVEGVEAMAEAQGPGSAAAKGRAAGGASGKGASNQRASANGASRKRSSRAASGKGSGKGETASGKTASGKRAAAKRASGKRASGKRASAKSAAARSASAKGASAKGASAKSAKSAPGKRAAAERRGGTGGTSRGNGASRG